MSISKGFDRAMAEAARLGCEVVQIFVKNPRSWEKKTWKEEDIQSFRRMHSRIPVFAHLSYLPNLAKIDVDARHLDGFSHEVELCLQLGIDSLVVHCGSRIQREQGLEMTASAINGVLREHDIRILLENGSGQGNGIGAEVTDLARIFELVTDRDRVFLAVDTAHLFQTGYDIRFKKTWNALLSEVSRYFGVNKIGLFHLNDSKTPLASRVDRHWHIGKGCIGLAAFRFLLNDKRFAHLPGVMETPKMGKMDEENMKTMRSLLSPLVPRPSS